MMDVSDIAWLWLGCAFALGACVGTCCGVLVAALTRANDGAADSNFGA